MRRGAARAGTGGGGGQALSADAQIGGYKPPASLSRLPAEQRARADAIAASEAELHDALAVRDSFARAPLAACSLSAAAQNPTFVEAVRRTGATVEALSPRSLESFKSDGMISGKFARGRGAARSGVHRATACCVARRAARRAKLLAETHEHMRREMIGAAGAPPASSYNFDFRCSLFADPGRGGGGAVAEMPAAKAELDRRSNAKHKEVVGFKVRRGRRGGDASRGG